MKTDMKLFKEIVEKNKANRDKLSRCDKHDFSITVDNKMMCSNCNGVVSIREAYFYNMGIKHGISIGLDGKLTTCRWCGKDLHEPKLKHEAYCCSECEVEVKTMDL